MRTHKCSVAVAIALLAAGVPPKVVRGADVEAQARTDQTAQASESATTPAVDQQGSRAGGRERKDRQRDSGKRDNDRTDGHRRPSANKKPRPWDIPPSGLVPVVILPYAYPPPPYDVSRVVQPGGIAFDVSPSTAAVYVDGQHMGTVRDFTAGPFITSRSTPLKLTEGRHQIELQADGYAPMAFEVDIVSGSIVAYKESLKPAPYQPPVSVFTVPPDLGGIAFDVAPTGAAIYVDGQYMGLTSDFTPALSTPLLLMPGHHRIELAADGYVAMVFDVNLVGGAVAEYRGRLAQRGQQMQ